MTENSRPTFGLWYDFRQGLPFTSQYADFYAANRKKATVFVHEDGERAWGLVAPGLAYQASRYAAWGADPEALTPQRLRPEDLDRDRFFVGTPGEVAENLVALYEGAPYDHLCFWGRFSSVTHEAALANMRLFASQVAPKVRESVGKKAG